jgi:hypothetical protein
MQIMQIEEVLQAVKDGRESPARAYGSIQALRADADRYERDLIRMLRWDAQGNVKHTWGQVAKLVNAQLGSRQAAHIRWGRLKAPGRGQSKSGPS